LLKKRRFNVLRVSLKEASGKALQSPGKEGVRLRRIMFGRCQKGTEGREAKENVRLCWSEKRRRKG
jgi:hypothetical protein